MSSFPFGYPDSTALYLSLYVVTLSLHVVFLGYVLAGSGYVAARMIVRPSGRDPAAELLRDWLPFALGAAITAGVAPLLFIQILYKESFYTANLLLFHRWMALVPVLMIGFYLLYLAKSRRVETWGRIARVAVTAGAFGCFVFTAYAWTENHVLSLDRDAWVDFYASEQLVYTSSQLLPRFAMWVSGAAPVMAAGACVQLWLRQRRGDAGAGRSARVLAGVAIIGLVFGVVATIAYAGTLSEVGRDAVMGDASLPYRAAAGVAVAAQLAGWLAIGLARRFVPWAVATVGLSAVAMIVAVAAVREIVRLSAADTEQLAALHERAASAGGMPVFLGFLCVNFAVIAWCFAMGRRASKQ